MHFRNALPLLSLVAAVGCFAPVPKTTATPQPAPLAQPEPSRQTQPEPPPEPQPKGNYGISADRADPMPPRPKQPPPTEQAQDPIENLSITELFSWSISGNTPMASWSPSNTQLAFYSDYTQTEGKPNNGKKYLEIADLKTGKISKSYTITASAYEPVWLDESTLVFVCTKDRCGKGKNGVYTFKLGDKAQKQILPIKENTYLGLFPAVDGTLYVRSEEYPVYSGTGPYPKPIVLWQQWDPKSQKAKAADLSVDAYEPPKDVARVSGICSAYTDKLSGISQDGVLWISSNQSRKQKQIKTITPLPYYPGDTNGMPPCFSPASDQMIYFYYDTASKTAKASLNQLNGYINQ